MPFSISLSQHLIIGQYGGDYSMPPHLVNGQMFYFLLSFFFHYLLQMEVERVFSQLNNIETNKRTCLGNETLDDLLGLITEQIPLSKFSPDSSIDLWWSSKTRCPNQKQRTHYSKCGTNQTSDMEEDSDNDTFISDNWDKLWVWIRLANVLFLIMWLILLLYLLVKRNNNKVMYLYHAYYNVMMSLDDKIYVRS